MRIGDGDSNQRQVFAAPVADAEDAGVTVGPENGGVDDADGVPVDHVAEPPRAQADARNLTRPHRSEYARLLDALARLAQVSGTAPDLLTIYRALVQFACASCPANGLYVSRYDEERQERRCVYSWCEGVEEDVAALPSEPLSDSPHSRAIARREVIVTDDFQAAVAGRPVVNQGAEREPRLPQSSIAVPMLVIGRPIGAFEVQSIQPAAFTTEHVAAMQMAGNLAAIATQNVLLLERERQQRAVAENSEQRFRNLVEGLDAIVWEADAATLRYTFVSPQAEALLGYPVAKWLDEPQFLLKHAPVAQRPEISALRDAALRAGQGALEYPVKAADGGTVWLRESLRVARASEADAGQVRGFLLDVTERKELENQLRQAQKMEAVGRLAGGVAHDFNNMLAVITGYCELILQAGSVEDRLSFALQEIRKAAERAAGLTQQLLAFSRQSIVTQRVLDLNSVIRSAEGMLLRLIGEDIEIKTALDPSLGHVMGDPGQLTQMILNLAVNARDAMPQGGTLTLTTRSVTITRAQSRRYPDVAPGPYAMVTVSDTGAGMDPATAARIFEPFFTTKEVGKGTGLGLSTVHGFVKQSAGHIEVDSAVGRGTTFQIYLPCAREKQPAGSHVRPVGVAPAGSETILVVEDEDQVRLLATRVLRHHGYKVLEGGDPREALRLAKDYLEPIQLLLTDVVMPGMGGPQLARRLAEIHPETKVLYMSGYTDDAIVRHGVLAREVAFLQKPFAPHELAVQVRRLLDSD